MIDQARTLRTMVSTATVAERPPAQRMTRLGRSVAITGGKGGVGKSNLSVNLALELGELGDKVGLLDADFGLANADLLCGVLPKFHLGHVVAGLKTIDEVQIELAPNVTLIPGGSGVEELANFSLHSKPEAFTQVREMEKGLDLMLIDTAAGIAENVSSVLTSASEVVIVVTPEPTSIVDAYATIKVVLRHAPSKPISVVINSIVGIGDAEQVFHSISAAARGFLNYEVGFLGMIPQDHQVQEAIREQVPVVRFAPECSASRAIRLIAKELHKGQKAQNNSAQMNSFWENLAKDQ